MFAVRCPDAPSLEVAQVVGVFRFVKLTQAAWVGFGEFKMGVVIMFQPSLVGLGSGEEVGVGVSRYGAYNVFHVL